MAKLVQIYVEGVSQTQLDNAVNDLQDQIDALGGTTIPDVIVIKSASGQKWGFRVDETGMLILPGEQIP